MTESKQTASGSESNWPVRLACSIGAGTGVALALLVGSLTDRGGFWLGAIFVGVAGALGGVLGQFAGKLLFRRNSPDNN